MLPSRIADFNIYYFSLPVFVFENSEVFVGLNIENSIFDSCALMMEKVESYTKATIKKKKEKKLEKAKILAEFWRFARENLETQG